MLSRNKVSPFNIGKKRPETECIRKNTLEILNLVQIDEIEKSQFIELIHGRIKCIRNLLRHALRTFSGRTVPFHRLILK